MMGWVLFLALVAIIFIWPNAVAPVVWQVRGGAALVWDWLAKRLGRKE